MGDLGDILEGLFGGNMGGMGGFGFDFGGGRSSRGSQRPVRGSDIKQEIHLMFEEAIWGKEIDISVGREILCEACSGTGAEGGKMKTCEQCGGQGRVRRVQNTILGGISMVSECSACRGRGKIPEKECATCEGSGRVAEEKSVKITIPKGSYDGMVLRFRNGGHAGQNGGEYGDLYIELQVDLHETFDRRGDDIYVEVNIPVVTAVLGGEISVATVHGDVMMKIPKGTQPNAIFRLSKKGVPKLRGDGFGDEYVQVNIDVPKRLSRKERRLWEELGK